MTKPLAQQQEGVGVCLGDEGREGGRHVLFRTFVIFLPPCRRLHVTKCVHLIKHLGLTQHLNGSGVHATRGKVSQFSFSLVGVGDGASLTTGLVQPQIALSLNAPLDSLAAQIFWRIIWSLVSKHRH